MMCAVFLGFGHRHVKAYEPAGRPEDYGGDEESDKSGCVVTGQLLRSYPGKEYGQIC